MITMERRFDVRLVSSTALAHYMAYRDFSVRDLAKKVGCSPATIGHLRNPNSGRNEPHRAWPGDRTHGGSVSTPALDRAAEETPPTIRRAIDAAHRVYRTSDRDGHALNREVMTEAVSAALDHSSVVDRVHDALYTVPADDLLDKQPGETYHDHAERIAAWAVGAVRAAIIGGRRGPQGARRRRGGARHTPGGRLVRRGVHGANSRRELSRAKDMRDVLATLDGKAGQRDAEPMADTNERPDEHSRVSTELGREEIRPWTLDPKRYVLEFDGYEVHLERMRTSPDALDWIFQVAGKA